MKICGQTFGEETIGKIRERIAGGMGRTELSREVCRLLDWKNAAGKLKEMSCRVALKKLEEKGEIVLPSARILDFSRKKERGEPGGMVPAFTGSLPELGEISLVRISHGDKATSRVWNTMLEQYHYLGKGPLCGAQIRYLVQSSRMGYVGALAFSSAAWRVAVRDAYIGWSPDRRVNALSRVVNNSRFLILPHVRVPHLASYVLGKAAKTVPGDWEATYGERPLLLETFVEKGRFGGTCYRAAGWAEIGQTAGQGRQGRGVPVKKVLVYPLAEDARLLLREGTSVYEPPVPPSSGVADWAEEEFRGVSLPDKRLRARLLTLARDFLARPQASVPQACEGDRARTKAAYRFFDHKETTLEVLLEPHKKATIERVKAHPVVLCVQDTTELDYSSHPETEGLGPIGNYREGSLGLLVHDTMAFTLDGTPLGLLDVQSWARDPETPRIGYAQKTAAEQGAERKERERKDQIRKKAPIEDKESYKWLKSFEAVAAVQKHCPGTRLVSIGDREADIYDLLALARKEPDAPGLLIRALQPRKTVQGDALWGTIRSGPAAGEIVFQVPRATRRQKRQATIEIRFGKVDLAPPKNRKKGLPSLVLWAVSATEKTPPAGVEPLSWLLLTTLPVETLEQAVEKVVWYSRRWGIEVFHRTLKSGCRIEDRQLGTDRRLEACLAIDLVVAWRLFHLARLGRENPDVPCTVFFEEHEWKALVTFQSRTPVVLDATPPTLREAIRMVARLGGFLGRKGDGDPGTETLWKGIQRLDDLAAMWTIFTNLQGRPISSVSRRTRYG